MDNLKVCFDKFIDNYIESKNQVFANHPLGKYIRDDIPKAIYEEAKVDISKYLIKGSVGQGNWAMVPWICIFNRSITTAATKGIYIVYLLDKDGKSLYISFNQGCTELKNKYGKKQTIIEMKKIADNIRQKLQQNKFIEDEIYLGENLTELAELYAKGSIFYKKYDKGSIPSNEQLIKDLQDMIRLYEKYVESIQTKKASLENSKENDFDSMDNKKKLFEINEYVKNQGYLYSQELINNFYLSLKTKPFVILAGISGTGKSKIAKFFSKAIGSQYKLVAVRPDWSDSCDLFGHVNLENKFIPGPITEFLYEANKAENLNAPYILCLDEMNLARVEYYFSDFLSIIETRHLDSRGKIVSDKLLQQSAFGADTEAFQKFGDLHISENVYVVGTVNMDETTFPFSKKVLDRANTIEFSDVDLSSGTESDAYDKTDPIHIVNSFLKSEYINFVACYADNSEEIDKLIFLLNRVNEPLKKIGAQVAYRGRDESSYYITYAKKYQLFSFNEAMDNILLQKVLPRIQGSSLALRNVMMELFELMAGSKVDWSDDNTLCDQMNKYLNDHYGNLDFPKSAVKVAFMMRRFEEDGYTSYWL